MLFTAAGVDPSFLKAVNHKKAKGITPRAQAVFGAMNVLTQAAVAVQRVIYM